MKTRTIHVIGKQPKHGQQIGLYDVILGVSSTDESIKWRCITSYTGPVDEQGNPPRRPGAPDGPREYPNTADDNDDAQTEATKLPDNDNAQGDDNDDAQGEATNLTE